MSLDFEVNVNKLENSININLVTGSSTIDTNSIHGIKVNGEILPLDENHIVDLGNIDSGIGKVKITPKGTFNSLTQYEELDLVDYNGSSYIAKTSTLGNLPTNTTYWQLNASKGADGVGGQSSFGVLSISNEDGNLYFNTTSTDAINPFSIDENGDLYYSDINNHILIGNVKGIDGFSPTVTVSKTGKVATISITDENGIKTTTISDGNNGTNGTDGFSPTATISKVGDTATISITDKNGTTTATVKDGTNTSDLTLEDYAPVVPPVLTLPTSCNFTTTQQVTMTTDRAADIYYTTDNSTPTTSSTKYTGPLTISKSTRIKAFAIDSNGIKSDIIVCSYLDLDDYSPVGLTLTSGGTFVGTKEVTMQTNRTATIYYTLDGTTPTHNSTHYNGKPIVLSATTVVKAIAKDPVWAYSSVQTQTYTKVG